MTETIAMELDPKIPQRTCKRALDTHGKTGRRQFTSKGNKIAATAVEASSSEAKPAQSFERSSRKATI